MMKRQHVTISVLTLVLSAFLLVSCNDNTVVEEDLTTEAIDLKTAESEADMDHITDESGLLIEEAYLMQEYPEMKSSVSNRYLPDCAILTIVVEQNSKNVTIDFGEGCELRNGNYLSGKIYMEYEKDPEAATKLITYSFEDFYFNNKRVDGEGNILRVRSNENGNPQSTKNFDIKVTWPDNDFASKTGTRTREWIEGQDTYAWGDNVFLVTGSWNFIKKDGTTINAEITAALRRELSCRFFVSGEVELTKEGNTALLNYGDGACDDLATIQINGGAPTEVHLSNLRH